MSKRNLFVSFAESDGGHSYLAARAILDPGAIAHLIFRSTVAESLEAVATGQANYAVVPSYNSITQWEGATLKALASGAFEICAQVCMPTSYVLVAHKDYLTEFVGAYCNVKTMSGSGLTEEEEAKIYTRFLTRIYVGPQAEEQYRGRLIRPDMTHATIELSRNPLRVLEEMTRSELLKAITNPALRNPVPLPQNVSGGSVPFGSNINVTAPPPPAPVMDTVHAPAALVAAGLLDAPGDPDGWDQPGSLGEIVALLRKLLVLLNVYSLGAPDLPENKTQYLLLGRRGVGGPPPAALRCPAAAPTRLMALIKPTIKKSSADQWMRPRTALARRVREFGFVLDRPPLMLSPGNQRIFLFEGGKPKDGVFLPIGLFERWSRRIGDWAPGDKDGRKAKDKSLRKAIERKPDGLKDDAPGKFDTLFLGQYPTWCHGLSDDNCWCCEEAHGDSGIDDSAGIWQWLIAALVALTVLALLLGPAYCGISGSCNWFDRPTSLPDVGPSEVAPPPLPPPLEPVRPYPGATPVAPPVESGPIIAPPPPPPPKLELPKIPIFHVAFFEAKANLTVEALNSLGSAASQVMQLNKTVMVRVVALGPREDDEVLWERRLYAVKDELVRLGVPADRIRYEGDGPYNVTIRSNGSPPKIYDTDSVDDPMSSDN